MAHRSGEPLWEHLPLYCPPNSLLSSLGYESPNTCRHQSEVAQTGCLREAAPGMKAGEEGRSHVHQVSAQKPTWEGKRPGDQRGCVFRDGCSVTSMALLGPGEPCSQMEDWPGANSAIGE